MSISIYVLIHISKSAYMYMYIKKKKTEYVYAVLWGGYDEKALSEYESLLQNIVSSIGLFCKRDP